MPLRLLPLLLALLCWTCPAQAQDDPPELVQLRPLLGSEGYHGRVKELWARQSQLICGEAANPGMLKELAVNVITPLIFDDAQQLVGGAWIHSLQGVACKALRAYNFLFIVEDIDIRSDLLLPGSTQADIPLQADSLTEAVAVTRKAFADCKSIEPTDTRFLSELPESGGAWVERWTMNACGQSVELNLWFTPEESGKTLFSAQMAK